MSSRLQRDLMRIEHLRRRRQLLGWLASGGALAFLSARGHGRSRSGSSTPSASSSSSTASACIADPAETSGPFPADGSNSANRRVSNILTASGIVRSDIRSSFGSSTTTAPGVPLQLTISLVNSNKACAPLQGYAIYIWHCNRNGNYSLYSSGVQNENYLRGVQVTDARGQVNFTTIFPACYSARYPHIHFEIYPGLAAATSYANSVLISQMAMPSSICKAVYGNATGYTQSLSNFATVSTSTDNVFGDNTAAQIARQTPALAGSISAGYTGTIVVGVGA